MFVAVVVGEGTAEDIAEVVLDSGGGGGGGVDMVVSTELRVDCTGVVVAVVPPSLASRTEACDDATQQQST